MPVFSQKRYKKELEKADELFYTKKYGEAYFAYKQIYQKHADEKDLLLKMADCNYLIENYPVAQDYYAKYFSDTIYSGIEQFSNYAAATKRLGKVVLAAKLYQKIYENKQDPEAKATYELYRLYGDSSHKVKCYNLDSNYTCVILDGSESVDSEAVPLAYIWNFDDGVASEGMVTEHCFSLPGAHKVTLSVRDKYTGVVHVNDTSITVYVDGPNVKFNTPPAEQRVQFIDLRLDASDTEIPGYEVIEYIWDMGNGETMREKKIKYRYNNMGTYKVKLTVIARDKATGARNLFASYRMIDIHEIYSTPGKTFSDKYNDAKK